MGRDAERGATGWEEWRGDEERDSSVADGPTLREGVRRAQRDERAGHGPGEGGRSARAERERPAPRGERERKERAGEGGLARAGVAKADRLPEPALPEDVSANQLDAQVRRDLRGLQKETAEKVALHLVAAGKLVDDDPEQALAHARYARQRASRIAIVREAAGIAAYHAGEWNEALGELRAARRMGGGPGHLAVMADIERALGRPERALELARGPEAKELDRAERVELAIVAAGARRDLGEIDAAVVGLQGEDLNPALREPWSARLFYAYADNLLAAGRESDAVEWFVHAVDADTESDTDAKARLAELTGEELDEPEQEPYLIEEEAQPVSEEAQSEAAETTDVGRAGDAEPNAGSAGAGPNRSDAESPVPAVEDSTCAAGESVLSADLAPAESRPGAELGALGEREVEESAAAAEEMGEAEPAGKPSA